MKNYLSPPSIFNLFLDNGGGFCVQLGTLRETTDNYFFELFGYTKDLKFNLFGFEMTIFKHFLTILQNEIFVKTFKYVIKSFANV